MLTPGGRTIKACRENLISNLKDRESYRQDSDPKVIQEEPGQPKVWGWYYNAKNSMGGYGDGSEVLCYQEESGRVIQQSFGVDDAEKRRLFLAVTSPKIQKEIAEKAAAAAKAKADKEAASAAKRKKERQAAAAARAQANRIYNRNYAELTRFCKSEVIRDPQYQYIDVDIVDLAPYRMKNKSTVNMYLMMACNTMKRGYTNEYGDKFSPQEAFDRGFNKFPDSSVEKWGENREVICKVKPRFCK